MCVPWEYIVVNIQIDDSGILAKISLTERVKQEQVNEVAPIESSSEKLKKKRKQLIDRIRKRE
ncbi:hypothetical protein IGI39_002257 [Enterococcus sp. AZ135]|uniref:hypothetical protein n=1 Tax=unclassified Enterococcus TaxID=2608891 RepID=UPI003F29BFA7